MSQAIAFDTHRFVKNLTASGFTEAQAEALADEQVHLLNSNLASKADILAVSSDVLAVESDVREVRGDIREVKSELELKIEKARVRSATWMLAGWVAQTGVLATLFWIVSSGPPGG